MWLNEGLAVLAADRLLGRPTVKTDTLDVVARSASGEPIRRVNSVNEKNQDAVVALYIRGYWIARYLEEVQPGLLESLLARPRRHAELEGQIANALGMSREAFWNSIGGTVASHFGQPSTPGEQLG